MAHIQQQEFCRSVLNKYPDFFRHKFVLDIGSLDINGNNQEWFDNCKYLGIDVAYGKNVDIVSKGHELKFPDATFDIIVSTECFEHDQYYNLTIKNIYRMLKPGGLFMFTCATTGRAEHGTRRTTPEDAPLLQKDQEWSDYYKNLTEDDIREVLDIESFFGIFEFSTNEISKDLYFYGFKAGEFYFHDGYSMNSYIDKLEDTQIALTQTKEELDQTRIVFNELKEKLKNKEEKIHDYIRLIDAKAQENRVLQEDIGELQELVQSMRIKNRLKNLFFRKLN